MFRIVRQMAIIGAVSAIFFATFWFHAKGQIHLFAGNAVLSSRTVHEILHAPMFVEEGIGSWYGPGFHGKKTANGEQYNMNDFTAAHMTMPFGTILRVTNMQNSRSTLVRVNDRGPYVQGRILDLSYSAARELQLYGAGTAELKIEVFKFPGGFGTEFISGSQLSLLALDGVNASGKGQLSEQAQPTHGEVIALTHEMQTVAVLPNRTDVLHQTDCLKDALKVWKDLRKSHRNVVLMAKRVNLGDAMAAQAENECRRARQRAFVRAASRSSEPFQYTLASLKHPKFKLQEPSERFEPVREPSDLE
jgi:rare lipoprotein A